MGKIWFVYLVLVNLAAFLIMGEDKRRARRGRWRIPERTLFLPAVFGGALGGIFGMKIFHHKTRHWYFKWGFPALFLLQAGGGLWLLIQAQK